MKQIKLTLVLTVLMSMVGLQAFAEFDRTEKVKFGIRNIYYYVDRENNLAEVTSLPSGQYTGNVVIPSSVDELNGATFKVVSIDNSAFQRCTALTSVTIGNSVTSIGNSAFYGCSGLTSVTIGNSVTSIGSSAFANCVGLTAITIPESVMSIGNYAFRSCSSLTSIQVASGNTVYDSRDNCNAIIETATNTLLTGCQNTTIPNTVTSIGSYAFANCVGLTAITIPESVMSIGYGAFERCSGLTSIQVASGNTVYDSRNNCNAIIESATNTLMAGCQNTIIPESVTSIGDGAFYGCSGLTSITIPNSVTSIGGSAFYNCSGLTSVTIPNSVTSIGYGAFENCSGLTSITIPNSVTSIDGYAFRSCSSLTSVTIPNSVTSIGSYAFANCVGLTAITIPESVMSIGDGAFEDCSGLTAITIPNSVTSIGNYAFANCVGLTAITIPESVTSIGGGAFYKCYNIKNIYCYAVDCPVIDSFTFASLEINIYNNSTLHVPAQSVYAYKSHEFWGQFKEIVPLTDEEMAIEQVTLQQNVGTPVIYNLKGQRIAAPTKGLNIINGLKVVIK